MQATVIDWSSVAFMVNDSDAKILCSANRCQEINRASGAAGLVLAAGVETGVRQAQALDRYVVHDVRLYNFVDVLHSHVAVPNTVGIDDDVWSMLALVQTACLIRAYRPLESTLGKHLFEALVQSSFLRRITTASRVARDSSVTANEYVPLKCRHQQTLP
jgi:hypothetical protein